MTALHHTRPYLAALEAERWAARARPHAESDDVERLVLAAAAGSAAAWEALVRRLGGRVRRVARAHRLSPVEADDVAKTTWLRLYESIHRIERPSAISAWVDTTARRESLRILRRRTPLLHDPAIEPAPVSTAPGPDEEVALAGDRAAVRVAVTRLSGVQREVAEVLLANEHPTYEGVSRQLGIKIGSVGPTRLRLLDRLRQDVGLIAALTPRGV